MPTRIVTTALLFLAFAACNAVQPAAAPQEPAAGSIEAAPSGAIVGSPHPAMLALLVKARAK